MSTITLANGNTCGVCELTTSHDAPPAAPAFVHPEHWISGIPRELVQCCDTESVRYALGGIEVTQGKSGELVACATDTRCLVAIAGLQGNLPYIPHNGTAVIPADAIPPARRTKGDKRPDIWFTRLWTDLATRAGKFAKTVDGRFPAWRSILPSSLKTAGTTVRAEFETARGTVVAQYAAVTFDPAILGKALAAIAPQCDAQNKGIDILVPIDGSDSPMILAGGIDQNAIGVVMPLSRDDVAPKKGQRKKTREELVQADLDRIKAAIRRVS